MKKLYFLFLVFFLIANCAQATIRRVGFMATVQQITGVDYLNFQVAQDDCNPGDTIQLYPNALGPTYTGTINKPVVVIGPGYLTNSYYVTAPAIFNSSVQNLVGYIGSCTFTIEKGSAGTVIQGLNNVTVTTSNLTTEERSNITIRRCRNLQVNFNNIGICNNWTISQCLNASIQQLAPSGSFTGDRTIGNLLVENSVLATNGLTLSTSPAGTYANNKIVNCIFLTGAVLSLNNAAVLVQNCIFNGQSFTSVGSATFIRNITTQTATANPISTNTGGSNNQFGVSLAGIFVGYPTNTGNTYSEDSRFALTASNSAKNAGQIPGTATATDCGVFGGSNPYKLSGLTATPVFIRLDSPSAVVANGAVNYTVTFSINSNN